MIEVDEDIDGVPIENMGEYRGGRCRGFIPSKWETVDPEQVEAQAITTSKWDTLDPVAPEPPKFYDSDENSADNNDSNSNINEEKRNKLREIEVKLMQYEDELESGERDIKPGWSIGQQIDHYRRKLLRKVIFLT